MKSIELFAGAGGLALGVEQAGFESLATIEWDSWACSTIRNNQRTNHPLVKNWHVYEMDVRDFDWGIIQTEVDLLAGGPPCQPFSLGGLSRANQDKRDMFPAMIEAVNKLKPKAFIVENVKGLLRKQFAEYFDYIVMRLRYPTCTQAEDETWEEHLLRLKKLEINADNVSERLRYDVSYKLINAADYGVPQKRERVFIVGFRSDLKIDWKFPLPSHIDPLKQSMHPERLPWKTVREALETLPEPKANGSSEYFNHEARNGARIYPGHTGSKLDQPSKTLKAGVHGVPGGENMMILDNGIPRYYTVREAARIQTFPDDYRFDGTWSEVMRQLGNAVPVELARVIASSVASSLSQRKESRDEKRQTL